MNITANNITSELINNVIIHGNWDPSPNLTDDAPSFDSSWSARDCKTNYSVHRQQKVLIDVTKAQLFSYFRGVEIDEKSKISTQEQENIKKIENSMVKVSNFLSDMS
jgi:hypothetical protein